MFVHYFEQLKELSNSAIENGKRKIYHTEIVCAYTLSLMEGCHITPGDGWLSVKDEKYKTIRGNIDSLILGPVTKEKLEKMSNDSIQSYFDNDLQCDVIDRTTYIDEKTAERITKDYVWHKSFKTLVEELNHKFNMSYMSKANLEEMRQILTAWCQQEITKPIKGNLIMTADKQNQTVNINMDNDFFLSIGEIL